MTEEGLVKKVAGYHHRSFQLGMIHAFCELVMQGVKQLALSPIIEPDDWVAIGEAAIAEADSFGINSYVETDLVSTDLSHDDAVKGKVVVLYYKEDETLNAYLALKEKVSALQKAGRYDETACREASITFRRLLSYSEEAIARQYPAEP